jgi:hypothetical protein
MQDSVGPHVTQLDPLQQPVNTAHDVQDTAPDPFSAPPHEVEPS